MCLEKNEPSEINANKLKCPIDNSVTDLFFSLVDYRNNLFVSNDPDKILEFYNSFENRDHLIKWMRDRPKGNYRIIEFNKDESDIIVVIPTMDVNGKLAKTCRDEIFKGLHIIFVESGMGNYYFNYAHNCNAGIKKAMEYNPKWIVVSNDDMYKIDDVSILIKELNNLNTIKTDVVFIQPFDNHTHIRIIGIKRIFIYEIIRKFYWINKKMSFVYKILKFTDKKFNIKICRTDSNYTISRFFIKKRKYILMFGDFLIINSNFIKNKQINIFDEIYINAHEDVDLAYKFIKNKINTKFINFKIGSLGGMSLGGNYGRWLRNIIGDVYFQYKYESDFLESSKINIYRFK
jgi:hypothetical protein